MGYKKRIAKKEEMFAWSLNKKIKHAKKRISEFYELTNGAIFISFSGGKDSVVLRHLVLSLYPNVKCVFSNTTNEYPEILQFVRSTPNVEWVTPKKTFIDIMQSDGFPLVSKKVSRGIKTLKHPTEKNKNHTNLLLTGITSNGKKAPSYKIANKWLFLKDVPYNITDKCCDILKKRPLHEYMMNTKTFPIVGTQALESQMRGKNWITYGCNIFTDKNKISRPLSIWNEDDIWEYIHKFKLPYSTIYDDVIDGTTGEILVPKEVRTGCAYCAYGANLETEKINRFERLKLRKPKLFNKMMSVENNGISYRKALKEVGVRLPNED